MLIKNGYILENSELVQKDVLIIDGRIAEVGVGISVFYDDVIDVSECWVIPGAFDIHAHFREPGFENKGTIKSESLSAAKGGITTAMAMPNLNPAPDCLSNLQLENAIIERDALINIYPYASVSKGELGTELSDLESMKGRVKAITDDGKGVNNLTVLRAAMVWAKANDIVVASHAEYEGLGLTPAAEYKAVARELALAAEIGCKYHFCHISTKEAFEMIKNARLNGVDVTCEVTPHHLLLDETEINGNTNYKMNPPLRSAEDRDATVSALLSGVAAIIATDHAPHSEKDKAVPYEKAPNGIIGFETMLPIVYTELIKSGKANYKDFLDWVVYNPAERFKLPCNKIEVGEVADIAVLDINHERKYTKGEILSKSKNSPYIGKKFYGFNRLTVHNGKVIFRDI